LRGASAIQSVFEQVHNSGLRAFIVWEPVLLTDWAAPSTSTLSRVRDPRAIQFWDRGRRLSKALGGPAHFPRTDPVNRIEFNMQGVIWDFVAIYPPGTDWPSFTGAPVASLTDDVRRELERVAGLVTLPAR
jgi:hypothetical protein